MTATEPLTVLMTRDAFAELWETLRYAGDLEYAGGLYGRFDSSFITITHVLGACKNRRAMSCQFDVTRILAHADDVLARRLKESGGEFDLNHQPVRDMQPLVNVEQPNIVINMPPQPAPIVNVTLPEQPAPVVHVEAPDNLVTFHRNGDGEIVKAETTTAPVAA